MKIPTQRQWQRMTAQERADFEVASSVEALNHVLRYARDDSVETRDHCIGCHVHELHRALVQAGVLTQELEGSVY